MIYAKTGQIKVMTHFQQLNMKTSSKQYFDVTLAEVNKPQLSYLSLEMPSGQSQTTDEDTQFARELHRLSSLLTHQRKETRYQDVGDTTGSTV